jgi:hypothetical protein
METRVLISRSLATFLVTLATGACSVNRCVSAQRDSGLERLVFDGQATAGSIFVVEGPYRDTGLHGARIVPAELFDHERLVPLGFEYCVALRESCRLVLEREAGRLGGRWPLTVEAVVEYHERRDSIECPAGWLRVVGIVGFRPTAGEPEL